MKASDSAGRHRPLQWLTRDAWLMVLARSTRSFGRAMLGVFLAIYLDRIGFSVVQIGLFITLGMAGGAFFSFVVTIVGDTLGRRRLLVLFTLATAAAGLTLAITDQLLVLIMAAFLGSFVVGEGGRPLENRVLRVGAYEGSSARGFACRSCGGGEQDQRR